MVNAVLIGYGKMGKQLEQMINADGGIRCVGIVDPIAEGMEGNLAELIKKLADQGLAVDVAIDFSHPDNLKMIIESMKDYPVPLILATTGFEEEQITDIEDLAQIIPIVFSSNYSLGITVMKKIVKELRDALGDGFDIELIEKHHRHKVDAPSGTAKTLIDVLDPVGEFTRKHGREGFGKREREIGVHAVRGGSIAGEHTVIFAGENEVLEVTHRADSRQVFAVGAIRAAKFIVNREPGIYDMNRVLFG